MTRCLLDIPGLSGAGGTPGQWAVITLGVVTILYVAVIRPMRKGKVRRDPLERPARLGSLAQQRAVERDMGNLLVEYEEMIRRMTAQVDTRATKLELLIKDAEDVLARLKAALVEADGAAPGMNGRPDAGTASQQSEDRDGSVGPTQTPGTDEKERAGGVAAGDGTGGQPGDDPPDSAGGGDHRHDEVYRLADGGQSARDIAKRLGRPYGEIELILALRRDRPQQEEVSPAANAGTPRDAPAAAPAAIDAPDEPPGHAAPATLPNGPADGVGRAALAPVVPATAATPYSPPQTDEGRRGRKKHRSHRP
jgi:hypothetical protein